MKQQLHCAHLFADGHAVLVYEQPHRQRGVRRWAEVVEKFGPECRFTGSVIFHQGSRELLKLCQQAVAVRVTHATLEVEVDQTQFNPVWHRGLASVLGAPYTYQPEEEQSFDPNITGWAGCRVRKVHRRPAKQTTARLARKTNSQAA